VVAVTINHENLDGIEVQHICTEITDETGLPACDILVEGPGKVIQVLTSYLTR